MLVLTRRKGQRIIIDDDVIIELLEIRGDRIRLGITAPESVAIHREEIHDLIHGKESSENNQHSAST